MRQRRPQIRLFKRCRNKNAAPCLQEAVEAGRRDGIQKKHDEIRPELKAELKAASISDYSIFLDQETFTLFAVQKLSDGNTASALPRSPIVCKWWDAMAPLMQVHPDNSPVATPLREVVHLD